MMRSMTGYGRGEHLEHSRKFVVEIKSVNHRYNDINIKLPRSLNPFEDKIKKRFTADIFRGKTDVYISFETYAAEDIKFKLNEILADAYVKELQHMQARYSLEGSIPLELVARYPDIVSVEKSLEDGSGAQGELYDTLLLAAEAALKQFISMREVEGEALKKNLLTKLTLVASLAQGVAEYAPTVVAEYRQRLSDRLKEIYAGDISEARLMTELAIFADRSCIDEELTRLSSHIDQFKTIVDETEPVGRKLDFLVQEMIRETNTIASKSNNLNITNITVDLKNEIEKIREQIQNIE